MGHFLAPPTLSPFTPATQGYPGSNGKHIYCRVMPSFYLIFLKFQRLGYLQSQQCHRFSINKICKEGVGRER